jgi:hypothetical protein
VHVPYAVYDTVLGVLVFGISTLVVYQAYWGKLGYYVHRFPALLLLHLQVADELLEITGMHVTVITFLRNFRFWPLLSSSLAARLYLRHCDFYAHL